MGRVKGNFAFCKKEKHALRKDEIMASVFEVGRCYTFFDSGYPPLEVLKRTDKTVWVRNESNAWRMRIRHDDDGEYAIDSSEPRSWSDIFTVHSKYPMDAEESEYFKKCHAEAWANR